MVGFRKGEEEYDRGDDEKKINEVSGNVMVHYFSLQPSEFLPKLHHEKCEIGIIQVFSKCFKSTKYHFPG